MVESQTFTEEELQRIINAPKEVQEKIAQYAALYKDDTAQLIGSVRGVLGPGNDAMVESPTSVGLADKVAQVQQTSGTENTFNQKDLELLKDRVQSRVKEMIASGASDAQIQQAVAGMAGSPELASVAKEVAQQQLDAEKFNIFNTRNQNNQNTEMVADNRLPYKDLGDTLAAIAAAGQFIPQADLPNLKKPGIDQGVGGVA